MIKKKIILTGGGSAGHVTPNVALLPELKEHGFEIEYIGSENGIEKNIIEKLNIKYYSISCGKLRRYFDLKNFSDPFKIIKGIFQASAIIKREKPSIVFSKGGFVSVPVVIGAYLNKVPVIAHESDITPGLANKMSSPYCTKICVTFPEALEKINKNKSVLTGTPIREELLKGNRNIGLGICNFNGNKPVLLVIGGSLGSKVINDLIRQNLSELVSKYDIIHICGKGNLDNKSEKISSYKQFEYVSEELPHLMAAADIVISRAGANTIFELLALKKPNLLIPLSMSASRGDQILNAKSFKKSGYSSVLPEEELSKETFLKELDKLYQNRIHFIENMKKSGVRNGAEQIVKLIEEYAKF